MTRPVSNALTPKLDRVASRQRGMTMVELLVALVISLLISLAAISALIVTRQGFTTVDASSQLRDNGRFVSDLIQRIGVQAGFKDVFYATQVASAAETAANIAPNIYGFDNALASATDPLNSATARTSGVEGYGSDILILRYQSVETFPGSLVSDKSMIDCAGNSSATTPSRRAERFASIFHVDVSQGETTLMCTTVAPDGTVSAPQPIVQGVEDFQVLYGVDGYSTANTLFNGAQDTVPDRYLRADQMVVGATDSAATYNNWRRVRSIRVGMVLRGPLNSQQEKVSQTFYPFGPARAASSAALGTAMSSASGDIGTVFTPAVDGRFRQVVTFTVHMRNDQGL
jgi:type IV pilus assembly protein PilW